MNAWRRIHRIEESLLACAPEEDRYLAAVVDRARLKASSIEGSALLVEQLTRVLGDGEKSQTTPGTSSSRQTSRAGLPVPSSQHTAWTHQTRDDALIPGEVLKRLGSDQTLPWLQEARYTLNRYRNDLWDQLVRLRNLLFVTMVLMGCVAYAVLALGVVRQLKPSALMAAVAFFLVGAAVGLFGELYSVSRRRSGVVNDYGLAYVRVLATPLLSGTAAVVGVLLTRVASTTGEVPQLTEIFSIRTYPAGLVVAAVFGLTPNFLLQQLHAQAEKYKEDIAKTGVGGEETGANS